MGIQLFERLEILTFELKYRINKYFNVFKDIKNSATNFCHLIQMCLLI